VIALLFGSPISAPVHIGPGLDGDTELGQRTDSVKIKFAGWLMTFWTPTLPFQIIYIYIIVYAIIVDIRYLKIPNLVSVILAVSSLPYFILFLPASEILSRVEVTVIIFLLAFFFYHHGWFGGGDVKLLTAVSLWMGTTHIAAFALLMAVLGSLLALLLLNLRWIVNVDGKIPANRLPTVVKRWVDEGVCPYGVAIGVAALGMGPLIFP
jgi:prepilin peptidase CpaA